MSKGGVKTSLISLLFCVLPLRIQFQEVSTFRTKLCLVEFKIFSVFSHKQLSRSNKKKTQANNKPNNDKPNNKLLSNIFKFSVMQSE